MQAGAHGVLNKYMAIDFNNPDMDAVNLTKAIGMQEGGGKINYNAIGDAGTSKGAYQWQPGNFEAAAKDAGLDPTDFSPANQDKVAYAKVKSMKDQGLKPWQIASAWNSGGTENWKDHSGDTIINGQKIHYDTPAYVNNVKNYYMKLSGGTQAPLDTTTDNTQTTPSIGAQVLGADPTNTYGAIAPASSTDNPLQAGLKSIANVPSSLLNLGKSLFSAATHPVNTIKGIANAFGGGIEEGYDALVGEKGASNTQTETFDALKSALNERYGSLENAQRTATNDPVGFGADVFSILEGGSAILDNVAGTSARAALDTGVSAVGGKVADLGSKVLGAPTELGAKVLGQSTGVGSEAIKTGFNAAQEGGDAAKAFTEGLRGDSTPEDLVNKAIAARDEVLDIRRSNYKDMLGSLKSDTSEIDTAPLKTQLEKQLENFNITKNEDGTLNFDESTIVRPSDQKEIESMTKDVENWKNNTPQGIDTLKQRLSNYWEPGSKTGAFSEGLRSTARGMIEDTPGYSDAMKNYSDMSDQIQDIKQSLSLGDKAATETTYNKLKNALKNDKQLRLSVIQELDATTGGSLQESIAGHSMSNLAPRGLAKYADIGAGVTALSHGIGILPILGIAMTTSPRIVGEIVNALGLGANATTKIMSYLNKFSTPAIIAGSAASKANSNP